MGRRGSVLVGAAVAAVVSTACGGQATSVSTEEHASQAVADTFRQSWAAEVRVDFDATDTQLEEVLDAARHAGKSEHEVDSAKALFAWLRVQSEVSRTVVARGDDGSWRFANIVDGEPMVDVRVDVRELLAGGTLTPDATILLQLDIPTFFDQVQQSVEVAARADPTMPSGMPPLPDIPEIRDQISAQLPSGPVRDMVVSIVDGRFGGVAGQLDIESLGFTPEDLDDLRSELFDAVPFTIDDLHRVLREAVTLRDFTPDQGGTRAVLDIHPRAAVVAVGELLEQAGEVDDFQRAYTAETGSSVDELPAVMSDVGTVVFDEDDRLSEVTLRLVDAGQQFLDSMATHGPDIERAIAAVEDARYDLVVTLSDVGRVPTLLDIDAVTVTWQHFADMLMSVGQGLGSESVTTHTEVEAPA